MNHIIVIGISAVVFVAVAFVAQRFMDFCRDVMKDVHSEEDGYER